MSEAGSKAFVLDSWAVMAYLDGEPAGIEVRQLLRRARRKEVRLLFSLVNYGECLYIIEREKGVQQAQRTVGIIDQLALHVVSIDRAIVFAAAHLKAQYPLSYADAFVAALAKRTTATIVTGDPEFKAVEGIVSIRWLLDRRK